MSDSISSNATVCLPGFCDHLMLILEPLAYVMRYSASQTYDPAISIYALTFLCNGSFKDMPISSASLPTSGSAKSVALPLF